MIHKKIIIEVVESSSHWKYYFFLFKFYYLIIYQISSQTIQTHKTSKCKQNLKDYYFLHIVDLRHACFLIVSLFFVYYYYCFINFDINFLRLFLVYKNVFFCSKLYILLKIEINNFKF